MLLGQPDTSQKIVLLGQSARYDVCGADESHGGGPGGPAGRVAEELGKYLFQPAARTSAPLLKVLLTDACQNNCLYCAFRADAERARTTFRPEELANAFVEMYGRRLASGIFLSSGLAGDPNRTMGAMLRTVEILRQRHRFPGYIHLKILPGAREEYVEAACRLADRVSTNLEAPNAARLEAIAPGKDFHRELLEPLQRVARIRQRGNLLSYGQTTQFVVGAAGESDRELLETTARLYDGVNLTRAYFSAFKPLPGTPLEGLPPTPPLRQRRLYQADSLLREYGFAAAELPLEESGNLPEARDPKLEWALRHPERFPLEVNRATRQELLRVPGIGPRTADGLLKRRRAGRITNPEELKRFAGLLDRAAHFLLVDGRQVAATRLVQGKLWPDEEAEG